MLIISALLVFNLLYFTGALNSRKVVCYADACIYGQNDAELEFKQLFNSSEKAILVLEADAEPTQTTAMLDLAFAQLAVEFGSKEPTIVGIGFSGGKPVKCQCEEYKNGNYSNCPGSGVDYCYSLKPDEKTVMVVIKYPTYAKNEVFISNRTITIQAKSGQSAAGIVYVLRQIRKS
jgi:hypothetical protein